MTAGILASGHLARCRGNGRFPYTGMTGSPAKIIASANGVYGSSRNPA